MWLGAEEAGEEWWRRGSRSVEGGVKEEQMDSFSSIWTSSSFWVMKRRRQTWDGRLNSSHTDSYSAALSARVKPADWTHTDLFVLGLCCSSISNSLNLPVDYNTTHSHLKQWWRRIKNPFCGRKFTVTVLIPVYLHHLMLNCSWF